MVETADSRIETPAGTAPQSRELVLEVDGLQTYFFTRQGIVKAVDGVSFNLRKGETLGIVGESGCGKSITALSLMRLVPEPPGRIIGGQVTLDGRQLLDLDEAEDRKSVV
jgi:peptide/nickel transport system ATP-binding protein